MNRKVSTNVRTTETELNFPARDGYAKFHRAVQDPLSRFLTLCWKINFKLIFDKAQTISVE